MMAGIRSRDINCQNCMKNLGSFIENNFNYLPEKTVTDFEVIEKDKVKVKIECPDCKCNLEIIV